MNAQFQTLFENVCRCFGHPSTNGTTAGGGGGPTNINTKLVNKPYHKPIQHPLLVQEEGRID